ncbi:M23 family metallopeptidase [Streptoalloteichus hindustanus]|uniref:Peptidase family M23 n=1 Tax=Streptoalloteichus hindustanus TaxID=2017 RepID=A0A1M5GZ65_STRHI|nr:M23 family metallopeptidase [Streptoalloteichus hindustanus]SHG08958.1 Peptidase family M23 [Streptoalloteichus hindustanus]
MLRALLTLLLACCLLTTSTADPRPAAAARAGPPAPAPRPDFDWPLSGPPPVLRPFVPPPHPYGPGHRGVDLGGAVGQPVLAAGDGIVLLAGPVVDRNVITIGHPGGLRTTYEPVTPRVEATQRVRRGQVIGVLDAGHPGCPAHGEGAACLHWGVRREREYLDPLRLLRPHRVRLLPWKER